METLIVFLKRLHPISASLEAELRSALHFVTVKKNTFLLAEGDVCQYAWYLQKGIVRCFYRSNNSETTTWFMEEDNIIVLLKSLFRQIKSKYFLQALEDSELYRIRLEDIQRLLNTYPDARYIHMIITERYNNLQYLKIRTLSMHPAQKRYRYFEKHFYKLINRVKLEHIASYLDMNVRTLTRIRKSL